MNRLKPSSSSNADLIFNFFIFGISDPAYVHKLFFLLKLAVLFPVGDDFACRDLADAVQLHQLRESGCIDVNFMRRKNARLRFRRCRRNDAGCFTDSRNIQLHAVVYRRCQVQAFKISAFCRPSGGGNGIGNSGFGEKAHQPRRLDGSGNVYQNQRLRFFRCCFWSGGVGSQRVCRFGGTRTCGALLEKRAGDDSETDASRRSGSHFPT